MDQALAQQRLESFEVTGITEKFDEFMTAVALTLVRSQRQTAVPIVGAIHRCCCTYEIEASLKISVFFNNIVNERWSGCDSAEFFCSPLPMPLRELCVRVRFGGMARDNDSAFAAMGGVLTHCYDLCDGRDAKSMSSFTKRRK